jgi:hypothetical protein
VRDRDEEKIFFYFSHDSLFYIENYRYFEFGFLVMYNGSTIQATHFILEITKRKLREYRFTRFWLNFGWIIFVTILEKM